MGVCMGGCISAFISLALCLYWRASLTTSHDLEPEHAHDRNNTPNASQTST